MLPVVLTRALRAGVLAAAVVLLAARPSSAETRNEFWPEVGLYAKLGKRSRLYLLAALVRADDPHDASSRIYREGEFGAFLDVTLKPILRPRLLQEDWERQRYLWARIGYSYGTTLGKVQEPYREHRGVFELTGRVPLPASFSAVNRGRIDLRDVDGKESERYRYRLQLERETTLLGVELVPFVNAEVFYDSRFDTVNRQRYQVGTEFVLSRHWRLEPSFYRQEDQRSEPAHLNALGLALKYYL